MWISAVSCLKSSIGGRVTDLLEQEDYEAYLWDLSNDGVCMVVEPRFPLGTRLFLEVNTSGNHSPFAALVEVRHADICSPSFRESWFTGCSWISREKEEA